MMRSGTWNGTQLVSKNFVAEATTSSSTLNAAYGLLWWVNKPGHIVTIDRAAGFPNDKPPYEGQLAPGAPDDAFWALGYGNEYVAVIPSDGVVAVRMGQRPDTQLTFEAFTTGVLKAL
jgi:CubicO group peptidase (beta-lactamase class C family)